MSKGSLNKAILIGRLGKDPEVKTTSGGQSVCTFSLATDDSYKDKDGNPVDQTDWHNVVAWRKLADICGTYLKKGSLVMIEGKIKTRSYESNGVKKYITEITMTNLEMLGTKEKEGKEEHIPVDFNEPF
jgi:single-strand DNA-binding protein